MYFAHPLIVIMISHVCMLLIVSTLLDLRYHPFRSVALSTLFPLRLLFVFVCSEPSPIKHPSKTNLICVRLSVRRNLPVRTAYGVSVPGSRYFNYCVCRPLTTFKSSSKTAHYYAEELSAARHTPTSNIGGTGTSA
jgi:hypothetical protein